MSLFSITIFLGAFLLFQVQPLLGRYILPWFGGGPSVWTSCMLFFQALLLVGYAYAHGLSTRLSPRRQGWVHLTLLGASLLILPIDPDPQAWRDPGGVDPTDNILGLLLVTAGLPYVIVSATSPLLQRWFHRLYAGGKAYRLYALSNGASLLALLSYPFLIEPWITVETQSSLWSALYACFVVCCGWCSWRLIRRQPGPWPELAAANGAPPPMRGALMWLGYAASGSVLLLATTNQMSQEIAVVPFLWILPLTLYLLSFVLTFESDRWYSRRLFGFVLAVAVPAAAVSLASGGLFPIGAQIVIFSLALFAGCMVCHGELALARPAGTQATAFYLSAAAGGALGGAFVALAAPRLFIGYWEYPLALAACCVIALASFWKEGAWRPALDRPSTIWSPPPALAIALFALGYTFSLEAGNDPVAASRNFYGVLEVTEDRDQNGLYRILTHGRTRHGAQYLDQDKRRWPTTYFGPGTGAALVFQHHPARAENRPLRAGVIGLGAGAMAAYGRPGDAFRFYEINPEVRAFALAYFTYLEDSPAAIEVVIGDARVRLEAELEADRAQEFDILAIDAFSSGAIPVHLLTGEAGEAYARHLREDGLLAFHISNRFLNLAPVIVGLAERLGMQALRITSQPNEEFGVSASTWMILTRNEQFLTDPFVELGVDRRQPTASLRWTDNFAGLWQALR